MLFFVGGRGVHTETLGTVFHFGLDDVCCFYIVVELACLNSLSWLVRYLSGGVAGTKSLAALKRKVAQVLSSLLE